jgi:hypothetical protein
MRADQPDVQIPLQKTTPMKNHKPIPWGSVVGVSLLILIVIALFVGLDYLASGDPSLTPAPARVAETLIPTPVAGDTSYVSTVEQYPEIEPQPLPSPYSLRWRIGIGVADGNPLYFAWPEHRPGWYLNWRVGYTTSLEEEGLPQVFRMDAPDVLGMEFVPMVRIRRDRLAPPARDLRIRAAQYPGRIWLIGNEPDVRWQDNVEAEKYAELYHEAYVAIKSVDPSAQVAIGGLSQITPLRLEYLNRIWETYQEQYGVEMPVDVWNMHAFVLREEADNWGVGIPPGFDVAHGMLWEIAEHDSLVLLENQVRLMRRWMHDHGQRDKPLYITEYGILMPAEYGFPQARVSQFLVDSFDLLLRLRDNELGYPADDNRLVQRWAWFSTRDHLYPTGDLFDAGGNPLPVMRSINGYIRAHREAPPAAYIPIKP